MEWKTDTEAWYTCQGEVATMGGERNTEYVNSERQRDLDAI